jgi:hypothetical protein
MPILTAVNIFCLANRKSSKIRTCSTKNKLTLLVLFTYLFGGGNGNEGLGLLSLCFDFQYIGSGALYLPLQVCYIFPLVQSRGSKT